MSLSVFERTVVCAYTQLLVWSKPYQSLPFPLLPITPALKCWANLGAPISLARSCRTGRKRHPRGGRSSSFSSAPLPLRLREGGRKKNFASFRQYAAVIFPRRAREPSRQGAAAAPHSSHGAPRHRTAPSARLSCSFGGLSCSLSKRLLRDTASIGARRKVYDPLG